MKKILIISVSAGSGHVRAAEAVLKTSQKKYPNIEIQHIDLMDYISLSMKKAVVGSYDLLVRQAPELWGFLYNKTNNPKITKKLKRLNKKLKKINAHKLYEFVNEYKPDYILYTHFLPADLLDKELPQNIKTGTLITDYDLHELWLTSNTQDYFVATNKIVWKLENRGISSKQIILSGIPIDPLFYQNINSVDLKEKYKIKLDQPLIVVLSGGQGLAHTDQVINGLCALEKPYTIIVIAGQNKSLFSKLKKIKTPKHLEYSAIGWTDNMQDYMRMADIIVSKSGGLTTTECCVLDKQFIAIDPIPGQEDGNARFLLETGRGRVVYNSEDLIFTIQTWKKDAIGSLQKKPAGEIILDRIVNTNNINE